MDYKDAPDPDLGITEEDYEVIDPDVPAKPVLDIKVSTKTVTNVDAKVKLDAKRTLKVKSLSTGIKVSIVTARPYYSALVESLLFKEDDIEYLLEALSTVVDARNSTS